MSQDILVRLEVPIPAVSAGALPYMTFSHWMPTTEDKFIIVQQDNATLKLWFDKSCLGHVSDVKDLSRHANVLVNKIFADVILRGLSTEMVEYIQLSSQSPAPPEDPHQEALGELGEKVLLFALMHINRLISFTRSEMGQYWLQEYSADMINIYSFNLNFKAKVLIGSSWIRWYPSNSRMIKGRGTSKLNTYAFDETRFLDKATWSKAKDFLTSDRQTSLMWELLAGAELLAGTGHRRSALTEAVTALEIAISEFARSPTAKSTFQPLMTERMNVTSLKGWVSHMGLSGTVDYSFPVIFSEEQMPTSMLKGCQEAVNQRQNVVHNGQRDVQEDKLILYLQSIRSVCKFLGTY